jgi:hypothetical protein
MDFVSRQDTSEEQISESDDVIETSKTEKQRQKRMK